MDREKLWVFTELFYPIDTSTGHIMTRLTDFMSSYFDVEVITGPAVYDSGYSGTYNKPPFPFKINRLRAGNLNKNNLIARSLRLMLITASFGCFALRRVKRKQKVLIVTNPAFLIILMPVIKKIKRFKLYIVVHDIFPENLVAAGIINQKSLGYVLLKKMFNWAYSRADQLIVLGVDMQEMLMQKSGLGRQKVHIVQNWADIDHVNMEPFENNRIISTHGLQNKIVLAFAGNLGRLQGLDEIIKLIKKTSNDKLYFIFIGDGAFSDKISKLTAENPRVIYLGRLPRKKQNEFLNAATIHIVSLSEQMKGLGVPSKSYNILAAGKPILFIGNTDTEIAMMVKENDLGWVFSPSEQSDILQFLDSLDSENEFFRCDAHNKIRDFAIKNCNEGFQLGKIRRILEE